jgi:hypothetical protein
MTKDDLIVGHVYSAKRSKRDFFGFLNDRQIKWIGGDMIQYDSPTVAMGRHYPKITMEKFLKWAKEDVTKIMPEGEWRT